MSSDAMWAAMALALFLYALVSKRLERFGISAPMIFATFGLLASLLFREENDENYGMVQFIATATLVLVLFTDAVHLRVHHVLASPLPKRLLGIGLPLTIVLGTLVAWALPLGLPLWSCAILSLLLAPTDAALGKQVVLDPKVPIKIREGLATESGLNDGLVLPILIAVLTLGQGEPTLSVGSFFLFVGEQVGFGLALGILMGTVGGWLIDRAAYLKWILPTYQRLIGIGLAALAYLLAEIFGGNGFIAVFTTGLFFHLGSIYVQEKILNFGQSEAEQLSLLTFLVFGAVMLPKAITQWDLSALGYALLSLTFIRIVPVYLCLLGTKLDWKENLFIGWFGPRGLASILYTLLILEKHFATNEYIQGVVVLTVLLSIFAHGISAPLATSIFSKHRG